VLAAYCDFLLDQNRPQSVLPLTAAAMNDDNLLLRRALALNQLRDASAASIVAVLRDHHELAARRGERTHLREAARFALWLEGDARRALLLAQENWLQQKEPADFRILVEAAVATRDAAARAMAKQWARTNKLQDERMSQLLGS
jgi:hypothetical protein